MAKAVGKATTGGSGGASARFRQRKISVKQTLQILLQSDIPDLEDEQQRELQQVETGVEKGEEEVSLISN
jgi:enhancer of polycomb-like protein